MTSPLSNQVSGYTRHTWFWPLVLKLARVSMHSPAYNKAYSKLVRQPWQEHFEGPIILLRWHGLTTA